MPEFKITHYDVYVCNSYVRATDKEEALRKFRNQDGIDGPDPVEWHDSPSGYNVTIEELT